MFTHVLLPIDLNHAASWAKALPIAQQLAGNGGTLHILGVLHDIGAATISSYLPANFEEQALQKMKHDLDAFIAENVPNTANAQAHVEHGHVAERILAAGKSLDADVIVMASHPPDEFITFLVGSNADRVVRHAGRPVMVVR